MARNKKNIPTEVKVWVKKKADHVVADVEEVRKGQKKLVMDLEKIKKKIKEIGVLGLGVAKKKGQM